MYHYWMLRRLSETRRGDIEACLVSATSGEEARRTAYAYCEQVDADVWLDRHQTSCVRLGQPNQTSVILAAYNA